MYDMQQVCEKQVEEFKAAFITKLETMHGKAVEKTDNPQKFAALASLVHDHISGLMIAENNNHSDGYQYKQVYYLSIEFLLGRILETNLVNLGIREVCAAALSQLGIDLEQLVNQEEDAGLGNGGLGRLAACYLDAMASLNLAGHGCGLRYRYGLFEQRVAGGYQVEYPDDWLRDGNYVWEYRRPEERVAVKFGGNVRTIVNGSMRFIHENYERIVAVPYDVPIAGYNNGKVNTLRLWSAEADVTNYTCSLKGCSNVIAYKHAIESLTDTLYPDDTEYEGKLLRLKQRYFLVSASLQSILNEYMANYSSVLKLPEGVAIHINDTHPALAIPELMRILLDEYNLGWEESWDITVRTVSYTNHTILPEAAEKWPVEMLKTLLPRVYMIINEINERFCSQLWERYPGDWERIRKMAIIADGNIEMAHLAIVGSHSVNGVSQVHTEILKKQTMNNFYSYSPEKFFAITNGISHRRWLSVANPALSNLICEAIGSRWLDDADALIDLVPYVADSGFRKQLAKAKLLNKSSFAKFVKQKYGVILDTHSIFDSHIKRIHAYKRQSLNVLHIMDMYNRLKENPDLVIAPRTFIFGGKAAPGYFKAKQTIKLINTLADIVNNDKSIKDRLKILFIDNYNVSHAELIIPASDVSEQIPTASQEACGTGNMKFMLNGAITIGTLDGANIEIKNAVGENNIFTFGLTAQQVLHYHRYGGYNPWDVYHRNERLQTVLEQLINGFFPVPSDEFRPHYDAFLHHGDSYFVLEDFAPYVDAQNRLAAAYLDFDEWQRMSIINIAHAGIFAGDKTFAEYSRLVWDCWHSDKDKALYHDLTAHSHLSTTFVAH